MAEKRRTIVSSKSRNTLSKAIRERRRWERGPQLSVEDTARGALLSGTPLFAPTKSEDVFGSLRYTGKPKTIEEMSARSAAGSKRRHARNR